MGPYCLGRKWQMWPHQGVTIQPISLLPLVQHLSFSPSWLPASFQLAEFHQNTPGALGFYFLFYRLGLFTLVPNVTKSKQTIIHMVQTWLLLELSWKRPDSVAGALLAPQAGWNARRGLVLGSCQPGWWALIAGMQLAASNYTGIVKLDTLALSGS